MLFREVYGVKRMLFRLAKRPWMGKAVGFAFRHLCPVLPVKKLCCTGEVIAFGHPRPSYAHHAILSPRKPIKDLLSLGQGENSRYAAALWQTVQTLSAERVEYRNGFTLIANGGWRQEVQQVHFHLFTGWSPPACNGAEEQDGRLCYRDESISIRQLAGSPGKLHFVLLPVAQYGAAQNTSGCLPAVLQGIRYLDVQMQIGEHGYSLLYRRTGGSTMEAPVFHVLADTKK